jgi:hypothetical protein
MAAFLTVVEGVALLYAVAFAYIAYLVACRRLAARMERRRAARAFATTDIPTAPEEGTHV